MEVIVRAVIPRLRGKTRIFSPPLGERVGIWRTVIVRPGSRSSRSLCSSIVATSFTSIWPKRLPMQIRLPPPNGHVGAARQRRLALAA